MPEEEKIVAYLDYPIYGDPHTGEGFIFLYYGPMGFPNISQTPESNIGTSIMSISQ